MQSLELPSRSVVQVVMESFSWTVLAIAGLLGNILVCVAFYRNPVLRRLTPVYIIALAISDILNCCTNAVFVGVTLITGSWRFGDNGCFVCGMSIPFLICVTISTMSLTAINRFIKATNSELFRRIFSLKRSVMIVIGLWITVALVILVPFYLGGIKFVFYPGYAVCLPSFQGKFHAYTLITYASFMTASLIIVPVCYYKVHRALRQVLPQESQAISQPREAQAAQHQQVDHQPNKPQLKHQTDETQDSYQPQDPQATQQPEEAQTLLQREGSQEVLKRREKQASQHPKELKTANQAKKPQAAHRQEELLAVKKPPQAKTVQSCVETQQPQPHTCSRVFGCVETQQPQDGGRIEEPQTAHQLPVMKAKGLFKAHRALKKVSPQGVQVVCSRGEPQTAKQSQGGEEEFSNRSPDTQTPQHLDEPQVNHPQTEPQATHQPQTPPYNYQHHKGRKSKKQDTLQTQQPTDQRQEPQTAQNSDIVTKAKEAKITKMMFAIVLAFVFIWIPLLVTITVTRVSLGTVPREITMLVSYGTNMSSLINPALYAIMNRSYRNEFKYILRSMKFYVSECCECLEC